jgi:hypothetical protein
MQPLDFKKMNDIPLIMYCKSVDHSVIGRIGKTLELFDFFDEVREISINLRLFYLLLRRCGFLLLVYDM